MGATESDDPAYTDVLIIGAGISGINAAYRIHEKCPGLTYTLLERRERIGGTWDLFRYPGIRSDSDIFTLSYPYEPWTRPENVADGGDIRAYLTETARKYGIDRHIRFNTHVLSADWDSATDTWTLHTEQDGQPRDYRARFVFFGTGYYNYDEPYTPDFPGINDFRGEVVHPQFWPESLDHTGKRVVVIGSGATAISLVPAMARTAGHVTMLQRSPTYMMSSPRINPAVQAIRKVLPRRVAHQVVRVRNAMVQYVAYHLFRAAPRLGRWVIRKATISVLPKGYPVDVHFKPRYNPWDQRMCLVLDKDIFEGISSGRVDVVTDHIDHFDADGIVLTSGNRIDADIVVTATGLQLQALGGITLRVDGDEVKPTERFVYKEFLLEDVPNMAWCIGYTNASWTLRADMTAKAVAKLLAYMGSHGYTHAYPHKGSTPIAEKRTWDLEAGYIQRSEHALPRSGTKRPWHVRHNYLLDAIDHRFDRIDESMVFGRAPAAVQVPASAPSPAPPSAPRAGASAVEPAAS
ncbi:flavin-containing monooxygenase [Mycolicibacterium smegmatis]|uniref:FAD-containing monooxygenase EthA n=1 Tax=Mycolicibacterium smegmatis TaxID=1772 RepID=A0A653FHV9_MYCSM|nr:NAD(P)/FAD-dependent oxidoreductase [Mycolicibacterium smegmatis]AIU07249.1 FAD-dependent oxidoreductase [Mycolicibacterium smegmatis MC2 155]AIU13874.1 FAD-dependent oxidoreductase [Mycolicibacterium smegmatis]AIU20498.1 FAD-dependent oxidoreductase [Mycolicibacterium smegmatis]MBE9619809.1 NAD(P)/FAD-dependent oxidoreductase [Mycolicibacterium smegmatis]MBE9626220.1 NAD(P)/FAD-dependent oxidoreductase [Mycolicibacterium smegmatis]